MGTLGKGTENKDCLLEVYGGKSFVKIYQAFEIGKVKFSFAEKENPKEGINIYVDIDILNCDFIDLINSGELRKREAAERARAKAENSQYCKAIWESPAGVNADQTVRKFEIQPGMKTAFAFRATEGSKNINVGCDYRSLKLLAERWKFLLPDYEAYMRNRFNIAAMKNEYHAANASKADAAPTPMVVDDDELPVKLPEQNEPHTRQVEDGFVGLPTIPAPQENPTPAAEENPEPVANPSKDVKFWKMKVSAPLADMKSGCKAMKAVSEDNNEYPLILDKGIIASPAFKDFEARANRVGTMIKVKGYIANDRIMVTEIL